MSLLSGFSTFLTDLAHTNRNVELEGFSSNAGLLVPKMSREKNT